MLVNMHSPPFNAHLWLCLSSTTFLTIEVQKHQDMITNFKHTPDLAYHSIKQVL